MEIDRATIKAISADARRKMLKSLSQRKKMPSELSKETGLSPSTIVGHLQSLETAGLIKRVETGHKWVYYELTEKGTNIVRPAAPIQFALSLAAGVIISIFGALKFAFQENLFGGARRAAIQNVQESAMRSGAAPQSASDTIENGAEAAVSGMPFDWSALLIFAIGLILIAFGLYKLRKGNREFISQRQPL